MNTDKKILFIIMGLMLLFGGTFIYAQVTGIPNFPSSFSYSLPQMPLPDSPTQTIFNNCPYIHPIELKKLNVYGIEGTQISPLITAEIQLYTNGRRSVCSYKKSFLVSPSINSNALVSNFITAINTEITNQYNQNNQPPITPPPISTGS